MNYTKPEVLFLGNSIGTINGSSIKGGALLEMEGQMYIVSSPAYETGE